jgi:glutaredoxin 3
MTAMVRMYTTRWCPYCIAARRLLDSLGIAYEDIDVGAAPGLRSEMERLSRRHTVPQIWIGSRHVGGFDDLDALHGAGELTQWFDAAVRERADTNPS